MRSSCPFSATQGVAFHAVLRTALHAQRARPTALKNPYFFTAAQPPLHVVQSTTLHATQSVALYARSKPRIGSSRVAAATLNPYIFTQHNVLLFTTFSRQHSCLFTRSASSPQRCATLIALLSKRPYNDREHWESPGAFGMTKRQSVVRHAFAGHRDAAKETGAEDSAK